MTVEGVRPNECVSAGWDLVSKGVLTVNGVTPARVSAAKLNELCHNEDTATLAWVPKDRKKQDLLPCRRYIKPASRHRLIWSGANSSIASTEPTRGRVRHGADSEA